MRHKSWRGLCAALALILSACPGVNDDPGDSGPEQQQEGNALVLKNLTADGKEPLFYSLATGQRVSDPGGTDWDIAFAGGRQIWTNSGYTAVAYKSGGRGGVWYTDKKDFDQVAGRDAAVEDTGLLGNFTIDTRRFANGMSGGAELGLLGRSLNVMTYAGYGNETVQDVGLTELNPLAAPYLYNKKQFYYNLGNVMPPLFKTTGQVYVIRHGDGVHHSKFQVTAYRNLPDVFTVKFEALPD